MISNYFKIALRSLLRQKSYAFINIVGLALGLATCLLIGLYVADELSYDRFHVNYDRIYRVVGGQDNNNVLMYRSTLMPPKLAGFLKDNYSEVEQIARFGSAACELKRGSVVIQPSQATQGIQTDASLFQIFSFPILYGDPLALAKSPTNIVLSRAVAVSLFGANNLARAVGQTIEVMNAPCTVVAVMDEIPRKSHLQFAFALQLQHQKNHDYWEANTVATYFTLKSGADQTLFNEKVKEIGKKYIAPALKQYNAAWGWQQELQPLSDIRLHTNLTGEKGTAVRVQIFAAVGILVLLLACVNYANLSTARSLLRSREVGVRKTFGATRSQVILQFLGEASGLVVLSFVFAVALVEISLPFFNIISGKQFVYSDIFQVPFFAMSAAVVILTVVLSGGYAALVLSSFRPVDALKVGFVPSGRGGRIRQVLVVGQFVISIALVIGVLVINSQLSYVQNASLGFNKHQLIAGFMDDNVSKKQETIVTELKQISGVADAGTVMQCPVLWTGGATVNVESNNNNKEQVNITSDYHLTGFDFARVMQIPVLQGRFFERGRDSANTTVVNAAFVRAMGWTPENAIGKQVKTTWNGKPQLTEIIGVVGDIHTKSFRSSISPVMYNVGDHNPILVIRLNTASLRQTLADIEKLYKRFMPTFPMEMKFLDEEFSKLYAEEENLRQTLSAITIVAIVIACLGLFGLAAFAAERRTKEVGIRKVLGASVASIVGLLSKDFLKLVVVAFVIATPLAYWAAGKWLQDFAYRIDLDVNIFVLAGALAILIAFVTVASQSWRAARANPVNALRSE